MSRLSCENDFSTWREGIQILLRNPRAQQACPMYEVTCPSQPGISGLGMVRSGGRAQTLNKEIGEEAPPAETQPCGPPPYRTVPVTAENPLSHHRTCLTHPLQAGILVKIKCLSPVGALLGLCLTCSLSHILLNISLLLLIVIYCQ